MLKSLYIKNYALIKDIQLNFEGSFTTITGETGAGKSILLGALSLLLGSRADKESLRDTNEKCIIEAEFDLSKFNLKSVFHQFDLDYDELCLIRREITKNKTRAFINDTPVNLKILQDLKPYLIDIHSQNESQSLSNTSYQYLVLDKIAKNENVLAQYQNTLNTFNALKNKLEQLKTEKQDATKKQDYNQFLFDELEKSSLREGLLEELENEFHQLQNAEDIQNYLSESIAIIQQEEYGVFDQLTKVNQRLQTLTQSVSSYKDLKERIQSILIETEDIVAELEQSLENVEVNPEKLESIDKQLQSINHLLHKHQVKTDEELIEIKNQLEQQLQEFSNIDQEISSTETRLKATEEKLNSLSQNLLSNRKKSAQILEKKLLKILAQLGMQNASINIQLTEKEEFHKYGKDEIEWLFSANKGMPLRALHKVASGGEMSRMMLAIKSTLATYENLPSIIFDEIDTGVSGEIALKMGEIMLNMSRHMQVISITHLPQIASKGKQHLKVIKTTDKSETQTNIKNLNQDERIKELSQMLGGDENSASAIAHAKSLLN
ncbi:DNA repair protein RecN [Flavobacterium sp. CS20]|uniref:DNA repair protein RecN n=1 Tax=Flavobacterium sp. CS20 TaxID=2775246 RepID=UPI001B3A656E|nr:DNA repair protein RecN [Flavobacterium sp. CS20]QTY28185.1 DNA repair protein RecN [Flavobacterium sp. CS20]